MSQHLLHWGILGWCLLYVELFKYSDSYFYKTIFLTLGIPDIWPNIISCVFFRCFWVTLTQSEMNTLGLKLNKANCLFSVCVGLIQSTEDIHRIKKLRWNSPSPAPSTWLLSPQTLWGLCSLNLTGNTSSLWVARTVGLDRHVDQQLSSFPAFRHGLGPQHQLSWVAS